MRLSQWLLSLLFILAVAAPSTAAEAQQQPVGSRHGQADFQPSFSAGTLDVMVAFGLGSFLYPHIEPGVDLGIIPIGDDLTISVGGTVDLGYCLICPLITATTAYDVSSWYVSPMGRGALHLGVVSRAAGMPELDPYVGLIAGPSFYSFTVTIDDDPARAEENRFTLIGGPIAGARLSLDDDHRWIAFAEWRFLVEVGYDNVTVKASDGRTYTADTGFSRGGTDIIFGLGMRF